MIKTIAKLMGLMGFIVLVALVAACTPGTPTPEQIPATDLPVTSSPAPETPAAVPTIDLSSLPVMATPSLAGFDMLDAHNGWGVTDTSLLRTVDGGVTWVNITPPGVTSLGYSSSVYFFDPSNGWVVITALDYVNGTLYRTTDGGIHWTSGSIPFGGGQFSFIDPKTGFVLVGRGAAAGSSAEDVYATADGGATWNAVYVMQPGADETVNTLPFGGQKSGITFLDGLHGWVGGNIPMDGFIYLYASSDGGHTWGKQNVSLPAGYETSMTEVMPVKFVNAKDGILPVSLMKDSFMLDFYVTHDAGQTWSSTTPVTGNNRYSILSQEDILVWDGGTYLHISHDGGLTWNEITTNVNVTDTLMKFDFVDALTGWMLTGDANDHHTFYKTLDGGATWNILIP